MFAYLLKNALSLSFFLFYLFIISKAQEIRKFNNFDTPTYYDNDLLPPTFHKKNREKLRALLPDSSVAIFFSASVKNRSNDIDYEFHQDPTFYYLTGIREPNAVLLIFKNPVLIDTSAINEVLFIEESNPKKEIWTGPTLGVQKAVNTYLLQAAKSNQLFDPSLINTKNFKSVLLYKFQLAENDPSSTTDTYDLQEKLKTHLEQQNINYNSSKLYEFIAKLRQTKTPEELVLMKKTCEITCNAFKELMRTITPGMKEYQAEAIMEYFFKNSGAEFEGYPSICGAGENSTILHYSTNRRILNSGDLLVVDAGAEYHGYSADVTRTLPVNGKFSAEQKTIYNIVLEAQKEGIAKCKPGANFWDAHNAASAVIKKRLLELGIIKNEIEYLKYFMHGTSHYLGLDVHDCGLYQKLEPGMIITVEPGIYIREGSDCDPKWWNIGIRIEDDVLITPTGYQILSDCAPKTIEEIEQLMQENFPNKLNQKQQ